MDTDYNLCDVCGSKCKKQGRMFVITGRPRSPTGELETSGEYVDLCELCSVAMLKKAIDHVDGQTCFGMAEWALSAIKKGKAVHARQQN